jgi:predicted deacylase
MKALKIGNVEVAPGAMEFGALECGRHRDGTPVSIPFMVARGTADGPTLGLSALIHGDEVPGFETVRQIMREEISPGKLNGTIIAIMALNPLAARASQWSSPEEAQDLNASFPGDPNGSLTQRIAHIAYQELLSRCDFYIDFHSNYSPAVEFCIIPDCRQRNAIDKAVEMAQAFGWPIQAMVEPACPAEVMLNAGKPAMLAELVGSGFASDASIRKGVRGTLNVLVWLGMIEGKIQPHDDLDVAPGLFARNVVRAGTGGVVHFTKKVGAHVAEGEILGIVHDIFGHEVETVRSPVNGYIRSFTPGLRNQLLHTGQVVATFLVIADEGTLWKAT